MKLHIKYSLFIYILAISAFEYFYRVSQPATYLLLPITVILFYNFRLKFDEKVLCIIGPFFSVFLLQTLLFNSSWYYGFTLTVRLLVLYSVAKIIGKDFIIIFINTIKLIAFISIVFYSIEHIPFFQDLMLTISNDFTNLGSIPEITYDKPNFIIYTLQTDYNYSYIRNAGPFWEPGVFAIFLNIGLFFNLFLKKVFFEITNILFIICIITTFSTTGYIALIANITFFTLANKKIDSYFRIILILFLILSIPAISSLPFMKEKVNSQIEESDISYSRFGAAVVHWNIIKDYPLTGLPYDETTYSKYADSISPNGITEIFLRYGLIVGLLYYFFLFRATNFLMQLIGYKGKGYMLFLLLILLIFSQTMGNRPIYLLMLFLPLIGYFKKSIQRTPIHSNGNSLINYLKPRSA